MEQLDDLLAGAETVLSDDILDHIDAIVPPVTLPTLRRCPADERTAA